jgi:NADPH:quinone reductase-like Zn-dependent oxidoreductase
MKAVQFAAYGGPEVLRVVEVEEPHAGQGQIRIAVRAAGINQKDWKIRAGHLREFQPLRLPAGLGLDAAGVVDEVGADVTGVVVGDAVFGMGRNTYSAYAVLDSWATMPAGLSFTEAAGYPLAVETAVRALRHLGVRDGETLLVNGASGGVGSAVLQLARDRGIAVIGTAGPDNQDYVRSLGAIATTYGEGFADRILAVAPDGVDAALDVAGSGVIPDLVKLTGDPRRVLSIADFTAPAHGALVTSEPEDPAAAFHEAARKFSQGEFRIPVQEGFPLDRVDEAHRRSAQGHARGRFVLDIG